MKRVEDNAADRISVSPKKSPARQARDARRSAEHTVSRIQSASVKRQEAWAETAQPFLTGRLTGQLDGLYGDLRTERKGQMPKFTGKTSGLKG